MEESVALDSSKQKDFVKSVKGLKKLIKKQKAKGKEPIKNESKPVKDGKVTKRRSRGLVYLSHIPHGFYENEMSQYFRQFGLVTNVRVIRSERTGNSKGYAFVEFKDTTVAQVVAETMNNYLMGKRLIKAVYIPPNKQKIHAKRKHWTFENNPTVIRRQKQKKAINAPKSLEKDLQAAKNMLKNLTKTKKKLKEIGIDYDFFKPVDIPEGLSYNQDSSDTSKDVKEVNIKKEDSKNSVDKKKVKVTPKTAEKKNNLEVKNDSQKAKKQKIDMQNKKGEKVQTSEKKDVKMEKGKVNIEHKSHDETQKNKKQKLKDSNVKPLEDFIGIQESDGDSDGSLEFNSDEFEKSMDGEDSFGSEDDDSSDDNDLSDDDSDESVGDVKLPVVLNPKKQQKVTKKVPQQQTLSKKVVKNDKQQTKSIVAPKRKADQKPIPSKKVKFEKQNNKKTLNKVIKKKK